MDCYKWRGWSWGCGLPCSGSRPGEHLRRHAIELCIHGIRDATQCTDEQAVTIGREATHRDGLGPGRREGERKGGRERGREGEREEERNGWREKGGGGREGGREKRGKGLFESMSERHAAVLDRC